MRTGARPTGWRPAAGAAIAAGAMAAFVAAACGERAGAAGPVEQTLAAPATLGEVPADVPHLSVRVLEVQRISEGAIDVRFTLACAAGAPAPLPIAGLLASAPADAGAVADVFAVDEAAGRKYFVVRNAARQPVGSRDLDPIAPGASRELWTRIAAPPPGVTAVTIQVPRTPAFVAVPITEPADAGGRPGGEPLHQAGRM